MNAIYGRIAADYEKIYVFRMRARKDASNSPQMFLSALNEGNDVAVDGGRLIDLKTPLLRMSGRSLEPHEVIEVIGYWNRPDGDRQARCHIPHHGIATFRDGFFDWFASICFICSNVNIEGVSAIEKNRIISNDHGGMNQEQAFIGYLNGLVPELD